MIQVIRETFEERYNKYLENPEKAKGFMIARLKFMPIEELAYLLAEHDKFSRLGCAEYGDGTEINSDNGELDPLGRKVDPWGEPLKKGMN